VTFVGKESDTQNHVLLIGAIADAASTAAISRALSARQLLVRECDNVHTALARIGRSAPAAIVVRVDSLDPREFEFFLWAGRLAPGLPMLVYTEFGRADKLELALRRGATAVADEHSLASLRADRAIKTPVPDVAVMQPAVSPPPLARSVEPRPVRRQISDVESPTTDTEGETQARPRPLDRGRLAPAAHATNGPPQQHRRRAAKRGCTTIADAAATGHRRRRRSAGAAPPPGLGAADRGPGPRRPVAHRAFHAGRPAAPDARRAGRIDG
jgi:hypothetical protein